MNSEADPPDPPAADETSAAPDVGALLPGNADKRLQEIFSRYYKPLVSYVVGLGVTRVEAEDIAAQAFAQLLQSKDLPSIGRLRPYLYKAARNITFNRHRHLAMQQRLAHLLRDEHSEESPSPETGLMGQQQRDFVLRIFAQLPPRYRELLHLRFWEQLSDPMIVERLRSRGIEINERTVRRIIAEGVEKCRIPILAAEGPTKETRK